MSEKRSKKVANSQIDLRCGGIADVTAGTSAAAMNQLRLDGEREIVRPYF
jgi:hypothetical protein